MTVSSDDEFGWRGWVLVGAILVAFVGAPLAIYFYPPGGAAYIPALVVLPLVPGVALAIIAVWAALRG